MNLSFKQTPHYKMYNWIIGLFKQIYNLLLLVIWSTHFENSPQILNKKPKDAETFCTDIYNKFIYIYESNDATIKMNLNVDKLFYDKGEYKSQMEIYNNEVEATWKRRVLIINTPRGNLIMYYDPYKMGFAYYSDVFIPYSILNAVSMKYCMTYRCLDFFMDEFVIPNTYKNELIGLHKEEDKKTNTNSQKANENLKDAPFAKLKSYNRPNNMGISKNGQVVQPVGQNTKPRVSDNKLYMNAFIYLGKTTNYSILQKPPKNNSINGAPKNNTSKKISWNEFKSKSYNHSKHMSANNIPEATVTHKCGFDENYPTQHTQLFYSTNSL